MTMMKIVLVVVGVVVVLARVFAMPRVPKRWDQSHIPNDGCNPTDRVLPQGPIPNPKDPLLLMLHRGPYREHCHRVMRSTTNYHYYYYSPPIVDIRHD